MPTRSSSSSVLVWPDRDAVVRAAGDWAREVAAADPNVLRIGYMGSYARGNWGVGSDLDLVVVVKASDERWELRGAAWDTTSLPVPADLLVYTEGEWDALDPDGRLGKVLRSEVQWLVSA